MNGPVATLDPIHRVEDRHGGDGERSWLEPSGDSGRNEHGPNCNGCPIENFVRPADGSGIALNGKNADEGEGQPTATSNHGGPPSGNAKSSGSGQVGAERVGRRRRGRVVVRVRRAAILCLGGDAVKTRTNSVGST